jgi:hypothetical protein
LKQRTDEAASIQVEIRTGDKIVGGARVLFDAGELP